jgi:apolipoprotein N-acyltransferase
VSILQTNISEEDKSDASAGPRLLRHLDDLVGRSELGKLVVFPEAGWPFGYNRDSQELLLSFARDHDRDLLVGTVKEEGKDFFNSAMLVDRRGREVSCYRKIKIVPFGEYIPMRRLLGFIPAINNMGDMSPGKEYAIFDYAGKRFGVLICFEDTFTLLAARLSRQADFLVNITNDEWFRGEPEASQHFGIMTLRAVENRLSIVRSANTGISGWTDFSGRRHKLDVDGRRTFMEGVWSIELPLNHGGSVYSRFPWAFTLACALFLLVLSLGVLSKNAFGKMRFLS